MSNKKIFGHESDGTLAHTEHYGDGTSEVKITSMKELYLALDSKIGWALLFVLYTTTLP